MGYEKHTWGTRYFCMVQIILMGFRKDSKTFSQLTTDLKWNEISTVFVKFEKYYSIGKLSVGLLIALGIFSVSRNLEPIARKNKLENLCTKYYAQIRIRNEFQYYLSQKNYDAIQDEIRKTSQKLESYMNIKKRIGDKGSQIGKYLFAGDSICKNEERGYWLAYFKY